MKPILFSDAMIRAILDGRKCQTRRIVKTPKKTIEFYLNGAGRWTNSKTGEFHEIAYDATVTDGKAYFLVAGDMGWDGGIPCSYGKVGDLIWVRETWQHTKCLNLSTDDENYGYVYRADEQPWKEEYQGWQWKPSIFMPREASRITLKITDLRVERVQNISAKECLLEGIQIERDIDTPCGEVEAFNKFVNLWQSINGSESWEQNPWVWVISFERI